MNNSINNISDELQRHGVRPTYQRARVLGYLKQNGGHPTVAEIFDALSPEIPSLSRATIYNTLHTFIKAGLIRDLKISEGENNYDCTLTTHGHFLCQSCGAIQNFSVNLDQLVFGDLSQYKIAEKDIIFRGLCPNCLNTDSSRME